MLVRLATGASHLGFGLFHTVLVQERGDIREKCVAIDQRCSIMPKSRWKPGNQFAELAGQIDNGPSTASLAEE